MSAEYTPGPWKGEKYCVWAGDKYVAGVQTGNGSDEQRANCMLIAAAPALLEVLQELIRLADDGAYIDLADQEATPISRRLRQAIKEARNE